MQYDYICLWYILDYSHKILLGLCVGIFGLIAVLLNGWLAYTFIKSHLLTYRSHLLLLSLCIATETKAALAGFLLFGSSALAGRWLYGITLCHLFAFLRQMMNIFQMATLLLLSIERYLVTRQKQTEAELSLRFYVSGMSISWLSALIFSLPPLLGYGRYNCGVSSIVCELDWRWSSSRQIGFNIVLLIFAQILPILIILFCLWGANCTVERNSMSREFDQRSYTKTITVLIIMTLLFWVPQGVLNLWIFIQKVHPPRGIPVALSVIAPVASEASEIIPVLCYLTYDSRLRTAMIDVFEAPRRERMRERLRKLQRGYTSRS